MRLTVRTALMGMGALAVATAAFAAGKDAHVMSVALPDGSVAQIHYYGDIPPQVEVAQAPSVTPDDFAPAGDGSDATPFAMVDEISAEMSKQVEAMLQQVAHVDAMVAAQPASAAPTFDMAALKSMPAGTVHYSFVSTSSGSGGTCSRSIQMTSMGPDHPPKVVEQNKGDCTVGARPGSTTPATQAKPAGDAAPLIQAKVAAPHQSI